MKKEVLSPGKVLDNFIKKYQISRQQLASDLKDVSLSTLCQILNGNNRITVSVGLKLAKYFNQADDYWINLQLQYDIVAAAKNPEIVAELKSIKPAEMPVKTAKKPIEAAQKRGQAKKSAAEVKSGARRPKAEKALKDSKPPKTKAALKVETPQKPAKAARETPQSKKEAPVEAKTTGTRPKKTGQSIKEKAASPPVAKPNEEKKTPKAKKPQTKEELPEAVTTVKTPVKEKPKVILIKNGTPEAGHTRQESDTAQDAVSDHEINESNKAEDLDTPVGKTDDFEIEYTSENPGYDEDNSNNIGSSEGISDNSDDGHEDRRLDFGENGLISESDPDPEEDQ
jgi:addiction module HigA family antidote